MLDYDLPMLNLWSTFSFSCRKLFLVQSNVLFLFFVFPVFSFFFLLFICLGSCLFFCCCFFVALKEKKKEEKRSTRKTEKEREREREREKKDVRRKLFFCFAFSLWLLFCQSSPPNVPNPRKTRFFLFYWCCFVGPTTKTETNRKGTKRKKAGRKRKG